ncbi:MAG: thiamine pyrophosphate-dependent enzyme [Anaerolineales bacterium]|nr:thiamine pyrophosphate-dependent enzyme [Anaerolineales bacterium]
MAISPPNLASFQNLRVIDSDGTNPAVAWLAISAAIEHVRAGDGACLLRMKVPRLQGHTFIDDQAYRDPAELKAEKRQDPIDQLRSYLLSREEFTAEAWEQLRQTARAQVSASLEQAIQFSPPDPGTASDHIFFNGAQPQQGGLRPVNSLPTMGSETSQPSGPRINLIDSVRQTLESEMALNPRLLVFGEDVGVKGGVHGATRDMQNRFGAERVFDTSLSEEGIIGLYGACLCWLITRPRNSVQEICRSSL